MNTEMAMAEQGLWVLVVFIVVACLGTLIWNFANLRWGLKIVGCSFPDDVPICADEYSGPPLVRLSQYEEGIVLPSEKCRTSCAYCGAGIGETANMMTCPQCGAPLGKA